MRSPDDVILVVCGGYGGHPSPTCWLEPRVVQIRNVPAIGQVTLRMGDPLHMADDDNPWRGLWHQRGFNSGGAPNA